MKVIKVLTVLLFQLAGLNSFAQTNESTVLVKDSRIDVLVKKQSEINKVAGLKNLRGEYKGYRIMILNSKDRELAYKTRSEILRYYPQYNVYLGYQSPYYKMKMGDFIKKEDAEKVKKDLSTLLKLNLYVVNDMVKITPAEEEKLLKGEDN
ncbi:SPOR domain-containing protein [Polluticaenibacter yanchengensis]|uniref:SPOR domain-containing protein n=1 Tax=Polluticaenibacter yanchengensis TaxID=3014562 RepID=A0ABT4UG59_9BACT|nr:SPOR domain-containing protein [Chitinophagaceae bacterium LY-5]